MVAMVDRPYTSTPPTQPLVHHRAMTNTKPLLLQNTSVVKSPQHTGSFLSRSSCLGRFFSSQKVETEALPPLVMLRSPHRQKPASLRLSSCVLPSSSLMSNAIIQSFRNRLLFTALGYPFIWRTSSACETRWLACPVDAAHVRVMLTNIEGNLDSESASMICQRDSNSEQPPHQRIQNTPDRFQEGDLSNAMNLITETEVTQPKCEREVTGMQTTECVHDNKDSNQSNSDPIQTEYDSDTEGSCDDSDDDDDDYVEFSDESLHLTEEPCPQNSLKLMSLISSESGYFDGVGVCGQLDSEDDCWSDDSDTETEFCSDVWDSFELQALSPMAAVCTRTCSGIKTSSCTSDNSRTSQHTNSDMACPNKEEARDEKTDNQSHDCATFQTAKKQVRFKPDNELVEVHTIIAWEFAYRAARKGFWEQFARDRCHFKRRIDSVSSVLEPCLSAKLDRMSVSCPSVSF